MADATETTSFSIRMPKSLREELDAAADAEGISTARQIIRLLEAGLRGGVVHDQSLAPLARRFAEAERLTGKSWREDVQTFGAASALVQRWIHSERPRPLNYDQIVATGGKHQTANARLSTALESLEAGGVIERSSGPPVNALAFYSQKTSGRGLFGADSISKLPDRYPTPTPLATALRSRGYSLTVDPETEAVSWSLKNAEGLEISDDEKLAFKGILAMVVPWFEQVNKASEDFLAAWREDEAALEEGRSLVRELRTPSSHGFD